jgi:hypothetical protein
MLTITALRKPLCRYLQDVIDRRFCWREQDADKNLGPLQTDCQGRSRVGTSISGLADRGGRYQDPESVSVWLLDERKGTG